MGMGSWVYTGIYKLNIGFVYQIELIMVWETEKK